MRKYAKVQTANLANTKAPGLQTILRSQRKPIALSCATAEVPLLARMDLSMRVTGPLIGKVVSEGKSSEMGQSMKGLG